MTYTVEGSWDSLNWWQNTSTENLESAIKYAEGYVKTRPFKYRRIIDESDKVVWQHLPLPRQINL